MGVTPQSQGLAGGTALAGQGGGRGAETFTFVSGFQTSQQGSTSQINNSLNRGSFCLRRQKPPKKGGLDLAT
jgi:hypothetical protein